MIMIVAVSFWMVFSHMTLSTLSRTQWTTLVTGRYMITMMVLLCYVNLSGGQECTDSVDVQQDGRDQIGHDTLAIIPRLNFTCNGRITGITARVVFNEQNDGYPYFQVWRATSVNLRDFKKINEVQLPQNRVSRISDDIHVANIALTVNSAIEFQSGDVVGYYHPPNASYQVRTIGTSGYRLYQYIGSPETVNLSNNMRTDDNRQPLIQFTVDVRCDDLSVLVNGEMVSCSSGRVGVGYEGDNCSFSCNTGYELIGDGNRTCQSDGSWSGSKAVCRRVPCSPLTEPNNGVINCLLGDDEVPSYEDTCDFMCNAGYELTGNDTRTCQSDGNWSGSNSICNRVSCSLLTDPSNGNIKCSLEDDEVPFYEDTCSFTCNTGYELTGSSERICQSNGNWSGPSVSCNIMECPLSSLPMNSTLAESCNSTYQSVCELQCQEGFNGTGDPSYVCNVLSNEQATWMAEGENWRCAIVQCANLSSPTNGNILCNSTGVSHYEDQCLFSCDPGYKLTGSSSRQCLFNGSWSGSDVTCDILYCDNFTNGIENSVLANDCGSEFGSVCRVECNTGHRAVGNGTFTCVSVNDSVEWRNGNGGAFHCNIVTCEDLETPSNGNINCSGNNQPLQYQDNCTFQCNDGYEVQGSVMRQCEASGEWSGSRTQCNIRHCPNIKTLIPNSRSCDTYYTSTCLVECEDGYNRSGDSSQYSCGLNGTEVVWIFTGSGVTCSPVPCDSLSDPENGNVTCPANKNVFQDTCIYYCNRGHQLEGNRQTRCSADGTWSSEPVTCTILKCNDPEVEIANSQSVGVCNVTYGSSCSLNCSSGYSVRGNGEHVCDDVNDEGTSVKWRSMEGGTFTCVSESRDQNDDDDDDGLSSAIIGGAIAGVLVFIIIIILLCTGLCIWVTSHSKKKKMSFPVDESVYANPGATDGHVMKELHYPNRVYANIDVPYVQYSQPSSGSNVGIYEQCNYSTKYALVDQAMSRMAGIYEYDTNLHYETVVSMEEEQKIYDTPCDDDEDCGPIYCEPPTEEEELYAIFEDKALQKLYHKDIRMLDHLGSGEFGVVAHALLHESTEVAVKTLNDKSNNKDRLRFLREAAVMCQFDHQNVIKIYGIVTEAPAMIVLEYMSRGDLRDILITLRPTHGELVHPKCPQVLLKFCQEIAAGMAYLSGKQFVHRDLAARNILVSEKLTCKIADFGMSRDLASNNYYITSGGKIPVKWTAPEALHYRKYSKFSDVWSFGCVMYEIWSLGCKPFEGFNNMETLEKIDSGYRLPPPSGCPRPMYKVMIKCWHPDPRSRPQFGQITKLLSGKIGYLLGWSDEDKQIGGEDAMKLGAPLESAKNLYHDLQFMYKKSTLI